MDGRSWNSSSALMPGPAVEFLVDSLSMDHQLNTATKARVRAWDRSQNEKQMIYDRVTL